MHQEKTLAQRTADQVVDTLITHAPWVDTESGKRQVIRVAGQARSLNLGLSVEADEAASLRRQLEEILLPICGELDTEMRFGKRVWTLKDIPISESGGHIAYAPDPERCVELADFAMQYATRLKELAASELLINKSHLMSEWGQFVDDAPEHFPHGRWTGAMGGAEVLNRVAERDFRVPSSRAVFFGRDKTQVTLGNIDNIGGEFAGKIVGVRFHIVGTGI